MHYSRLFPYLALVWLSLTLKLTPASANLKILDQTSNNVVFQTSAVFVRFSECGTFFQTTPAFLVVPNQLYTCEDAITSPPVSKLQTIYNFGASWVAELVDIVFWTNFQAEFVPTPWVLVTAAEEDGACSLAKKLENAANAGYSAVLLATTKLSDYNHLNNSLRLSTYKELFLDVYLINPWDIRVLSKYDYNEGNQFVIPSPPRNNTATCNKLYSQTRIQGFFENVKNLLRRGWSYVSLKLNLDTDNSPKNKSVKRASLTFLQVFGLISPIAILLIYRYRIFLIEYYRKLYSSCLNHYRKYRQRRNRPGSRRSTRGARPRERQRAPPPPPPPPRQSSNTALRQFRQRVIDALILLDLPGITEQPTTAEVNRAYRRKAKEMHPDKNPEEGATQMFQKLLDAKTLLLKLCSDAAPEE